MSRGALAALLGVALLASVGANGVLVGRYQAAVTDASKEAASARAAEEDAVEAAARVEELEEAVAELEAALESAVEAAEDTEGQLGEVTEELEAAQGELAALEEELTEGQAASGEEEASAVEPPPAAQNVAIYDGPEVVEWTSEADAMARRDAGELMCEPSDFYDPASPYECWYVDW